MVTHSTMLFYLSRTPPHQVARQRSAARRARRRAETVGRYIAAVQPAHPMTVRRGFWLFAVDRSRHCAAVQVSNLASTAAHRGPGIAIFELDAHKHQASRNEGGCL